MANERLRSAIAAAQVSVETVAVRVGVDPKTVQRWLAGRSPHPRHRWALADLLGEEEAYLWPQARTDLAPGAPATSEIVAAYAHRTDMPPGKWAELLVTARRQIDLLAYAMLFLPEQHVGLPALIQRATAAGCRVRINLADPECPHVLERDALEELGGTLPARVRMTLAHLRGVLKLPSVELRLHGVHLYNAVYRFDDEMGLFRSERGGAVASSG